MVKNRRIVNPKKVKSDLEDPDGWTPENNQHPAPSSVRIYPDTNGEHWTDYMEYYGIGKLICHTCLKRAKIGAGNCLDGGEYFQCVTSGKREKLKRKYESKHEIQTTLI